MAVYLFAYGTLQPGLAPAAVRPAVEQLRRIGPGSTRGDLYCLSEYPGARFDGTGTIHGTVYQLPAGTEGAVLAVFDAYEGVPDLYVRLSVPVTLTVDGTRLDCWAYQYNHDLTGRPTIPTGAYGGGGGHGP